MTRKETCREVEPLIDDLVDGALDGARERAVRGHLRGCDKCARLAEETSRLVQAASELGSVDVPPELWSKLRERLDADEIEFSDKPRLWWWWHAWRTRLAVASLALAAATTAAVAFIALHKRAQAPARTVVAKGPDEDLYAPALKKIETAARDYRDAVDELRGIVKEERLRWRPEVAAEFDRNLAIIDAAVERQREIAQQVPGDLSAQDALAESYRREIAFLQEAVVRGDAR